MADAEALICSICKKPIPHKGSWRHGNSAEPVNNGRCCDECDFKYVIPERIRLILKDREEKGYD